METFFFDWFDVLVGVKMDSTGSQQNSIDGNIIVFNNNDLLQQRTSLGKETRDIDSRYD